MVRNKCDTVVVRRREVVNMKSTTNCYKIAGLSGLGVEQTKRLRAFASSKFPKKSSNAVAPFDDRVRDVVLNYALSPEKLLEELTYLNSIGYGCVFSDGPLLEQIERFKGDETCGEVHVKPFRWNKNYKRALKRVAKQLKPVFGGLNVYEYNSEQDIIDALPKLDTHAGFEYIKTGLKHKGDYIGVMYDEFQKELAIAKETGSFSKPILPGFRLQCSGAYEDGERTGTCKHKVRLVSMVDLYQILAELMFAKPVQAYLGGLPFYAGGKAPGELLSKVNNWRQRYGYWISLDYSHYDQSLPAWLIEDAFELLWGIFEKRGNKVRYRWLWDIIVNDFINKKFVGPGGNLIEAHNGVPSGSMFTQIIDTICNLIMITTYVEHIKEAFEFKCIICGDDNLLFIPTSLNIEDVAGYLKRNFGITCHPDKCSHGTKGEDPEFLSRVWRTNGAWREPKELWSKLVFPERFRPYDKNPQLSPELIVYSYILAFPLGMRDLIHVDKFLEDNMFKMHVGNLALNHS